MNIRDFWKLLLLSSLVAFISSGCNESITSATSAQTDGTALSQGRAASDELPFRLSGSAVLVEQNFAPDFGPPEFGRSDFGCRCSAPSDFVIGFSLAGQATHLGEVTATVEHCTQLDFQTGLLSTSDGVMTMIAANGDELWTSYGGTTPEPGQGVVERHEFTGGTGRFAGASGKAVSSASCDQAAGTCVLEMKGVVVYDAAHRSE